MGDIFHYRQMRKMKWNDPLIEYLLNYCWFISTERVKKEGNYKREKFVIDLISVLIVGPPHLSVVGISMFADMAFCAEFSHTPTSSSPAHHLHISIYICDKQKCVYVCEEESSIAVLGNWTMWKEEKKYADDTLSNSLSIFLEAVKSTTLHCSLSIENTWLESVVMLSRFLGF